ETPDDNGGVHINSGIPNRAFYLAATAMGGHAWERAGAIWYRALVELVKPRSQFADVAAATITIAGRDFGSEVAAQVRDAWQGVGVAPRTRHTTPTPKQETVHAHTSGAQRRARGTQKRARR